jgi:predicted TIM-barrel fold metal-dependent hydrolase
MTMNDMVIISVDDHISEPGDMFDRHLSGAALSTAPKFRTAADGTNYWEYQGIRQPTVGLNAVAGRPLEEYGCEPTSIEQLRKGCYNVAARIGDMNVSGVAGSLNFASMPGMEGALFAKAKDKEQALVHLRAYNDWHIDEWCGAYPGRFIPCGILPLWDAELAAAEVARIARKGCATVSISENPTTLRLPSIHASFWEPLWKAIVAHDMAICLHIGTGNPAPHASMDTPIEAWITTMPMSISVGAADWLNLAALERYPTLRIALSEGGIGWIPYFLERADFSHSRHKKWTHSAFRDRKPSDTFRKHFLTCFIDDVFGLQNLASIGEDRVAYECDYPHSDSLWPEVPEHLWQSVQHLTPAQIDKVTHANAMRFFRFDPFKSHDKASLTVGKLRQQALAAGIDTTPISSGGVSPLQPGEALRPVTSGDIVRMFMAHAQAPSATT